MSDVVSRVALAIAIVLLVVAGATLLIVIKTEEVPRWLMNLPYTLSLTAVSFSTISLVSKYKKWKSVQHFEFVQKNWKQAGFIIVIGPFLLGIILLIVLLVIHGF